MNSPLEASMGPENAGFRIAAEEPPRIAGFLRTQVEARARPMPAWRSGIAGDWKEFCCDQKRGIAWGSRGRMLLGCTGAPLFGLRGTKAGRPSFRKSKEGE
jgi:hypothetical protein